MRRKYTFTVPALVTFSVTDPDRYQAFEDAFLVYRAITEGLTVKETADEDGDPIPLIRVFCVETPIGDKETPPGGNCVMPYYLTDIKGVSGE